MLRKFSQTNKLHKKEDITFLGYPASKTLEGKKIQQGCERKLIEAWNRELTDIRD